MNKEKLCAIKRRISTEYGNWRKPTWIHEEHTETYQQRWGKTKRITWSVMFLTMKSMDINILVWHQLLISFSFVHWSENLISVSLHRDSLPLLMKKQVRQKGETDPSDPDGGALSARSAINAASHLWGLPLIQHPIFVGTGIRLMPRCRGWYSSGPSLLWNILW